MTNVKKRNLSKEKILSTTLDLLKNGTYKKDISMRKISSTLDVQVSAIYWHYKNKDQLIEDAAESVFHQLNLDAKIIISNEDLLELALLYFDNCLEYPFIIELMTSKNYEVGNEHLIAMKDFQNLLIDLGVSETNVYIGMINFHSYLIGAVHSSEIKHSIYSVFSKDIDLTHSSLSDKDLFKQGVLLWKKGLLEM